MPTQGEREPEGGGVGGAIGLTAGTEGEPAGAPGEFDLDTGLLENLLGDDEEDKAKKLDPTIAAGERAYFQIWGVKPPRGYIRGLVKSGFNVFEIIQNELQKPGAERTQFWRDQFAGIAARIAQLMGARP